MARYHKIIFLMACMGVGAAAASEKESITLVVAGDVEWSGVTVDLNSSDHVVFDNGGAGLLEGGWQPIPRIVPWQTLINASEETEPYIQNYIAGTQAGIGGTLDQVTDTYKQARLYTFEYSSDEEWAQHPFEKVAPIFQSADISFLNLEAPLSDTAYRLGGLLTPTKFVGGLTFAGIDIVSLANNHMLDAERAGMFDTMDTLDKAGIRHVGAGENLEEATRAEVVEVNGIKLAFLAYTQYENSGPGSFATSNRAGVAPLDPDIIKANIAAVRDEVDHIILSFHWGIYKWDQSEKQDVHPSAVAFAREMIDAGADAILGHHTHVPRAVEVYKGKPIFYSLSHLIFGFNLPHWMDNYLTRLTITKEAITHAEIIPVAGEGDDLGQPYPLSGSRAKAMLDNLADLSAEMGTTIEQRDDIGFIRIHSDAE